MLTKSRVIEQVWPERMLAGFDDVTVPPVTSKENACAAAACCLINGGVKLNKMAIGSGDCRGRCLADAMPSFEQKPEL
ncbi:hypothetical protein [Burkholderia sp. Bp8992]|uniref:hypothetical protein n=1 Tax=Burkholderia sp. Bp8992 TaxID=2184554 RepID=UPI000F56B070|nr:hypothetical protein [Burkholderia sp. Bp8992]